MVDTQCLSVAIRQLYETIDKLADDCREYPCSFALDGNLLGSIGEVYAAEHYHLELLGKAAKRHDAKTTDGTDRLVQIKTTQTRTTNARIGLRSKPDWLLVLQVDETGEFTQVFNGPGDVVWDVVEGKRRSSNGQWPISVKRLIELDSKVPGNRRI